MNRVTVVTILLEASPVCVSSAPGPNHVFLGDDSALTTPKLPKARILIH